VTGTPGKQLRLLLIEDDPGFAGLLREMFREQGSAEMELTHVECMRDAESHLASRAVDIILLDPGLPDSRGITSVRRSHAAAPHVPLVVLSGVHDESLALQALQEGAQDYLVKGRVDTRGLLRFLRYAVERNILEAALFVERERAHVTLDSIGDAVASTDVAGNITFLNVVAQRMTGWSLADASGKPSSEVIKIVNTTSGLALADPMAAAMEQDATGRPQPNAILTSRSGTEVAIEDSVAPIHDRDGKAIGDVIVFRDVSVARATQARLAYVSEELRRSNRELNDFAGIASHDLQEPLRKIQAFGDRLAERSRGTLDEESLDFLRRMQGASARMQTLIKDLLEYSQVSAAPSDMEPIDLGGLVADVVTDLEERLEATGAQVLVSPLPSIVANPLRMRQLFQNLVANALKFHREGVPAVVRVSASEVQQAAGSAAWALGATTWEFRVEDNGIGFEEHYTERIFQPFHRLNGRQAFEGTGMGLAICRRIVEGHGGAIAATSRLGAGTTFVFTLPSRPSVLPPPADVPSIVQLAS
jgi:PAS domain S-box-containing protein